MINAYADRNVPITGIEEHFCRFVMSGVRGEVGMISKFEEALVNCSREPIHIPGAIQPFGVLLALDDDLRITQCSENVAAALGREPHAALGCSIEELTGCNLRPLVRANDFQSGQPLRLNMPDEASAWDGFLHRHRSQLIF